MYLCIYQLPPSVFTRQIEERESSDSVDRYYTIGIVVSLYQIHCLLTQVTEVKCKTLSWLRLPVFLCLILRRFSYTQEYVLSFFHSGNENYKCIFIGVYDGCVLVNFGITVGVVKEKLLYGIKILLKREEIAVIPEKSVKQSNETNSQGS